MSGAKMFLSNGRAFKDRARQEVLSVPTKRSLLMLPGYHMEDVKLALNNKVIDEDSRCVFVEGNREVFDHIYSTLKVVWPFGYVGPELYNCSLHNVMLTQPLDFAFVDLCGNLLAKDALWIRDHLATKLLPGADLAFTFTGIPRNNGFIKQCMEVVCDEYDDFLDDVESTDDDGRELPDLLRRLVVTYVVLFKHVFFTDYSFVLDVNEYRDALSGYNMIVFKLQDMHPVADVRFPTELEAQLGAPRVKLVSSPLATSSGVTLMATTSKTADNGRTIAQAIVAAKTDAERAAANRRLKTLQRQRAKEGKDPVMVKAGVESWVTRLRKTTTKPARRKTAGAR